MGKKTHINYPINVINEYTYKILLFIFLKGVIFYQAVLMNDATCYYITLPPVLMNLDGCKKVAREKLEDVLQQIYL